MIGAPWEKRPRSKKIEKSVPGKVDPPKGASDGESFSPEYLDVWEDLQGKEPDRFSKFDMTGVYGNWGTGKSTFALSFPRPIWYVDTEDGLTKILTAEHTKDGLFHLNLKRETKRMVELTGRIHTRNRKKEIVVDVGVLFHRLQIAISGILYKLENDPGSIGTVVIDDVGHLYKHAQEWRVDEYGEFEDNLKQRELDLGLGGKRSGVVGEGWDNARSWAATVQKATSAFELLKGQDCCTVLLSKVKIKEDYVTKSVTEEPSWHASTPGLCDNTIHMKRDNSEGFHTIVEKVRKRGRFIQFGKTFSNKDFSFNYTKLRQIIEEVEKNE